MVIPPASTKPQDGDNKPTSANAAAEDHNEPLREKTRADPNANQNEAEAAEPQTAPPAEEQAATAEAAPSTAVATATAAAAKRHTPTTKSLKPLAMAADSKIPMPPKCALSGGGPTRHQLQEAAIDRQNAIAVARTADMQDSLKQAHSSESTAKERVVGVWNAVRAFSHKAIATVTRETARAVTNSTRSKNYAQFVNRFPEHREKGDDHLRGAYNCRAIDAVEGSVAGTVYITETHLCFSEHSDRIKASVPWEEVASLVPSVVLPTLDPNAHHLMPIPAEDVVPTAVQLYTKERAHFTFVEIVATLTEQVAEKSLAPTTGHMAPSALCVAEMDAQWRSKVTPPVATLEYEQ